jgi:hypothetical protein
VNSEDITRIEEEHIRLSKGLGMNIGLACKDTEENNY